MIEFIWILLLALLWAAMTEEFTLGNLCIGAALAYLLLLTSQRVVRAGGFVRKFPRFLLFLGFFAKELLVANLRVAHDVVTPTYYMKPGILAVPLAARTDLEIALVANLITLTPGSLSLDVSSDRTVLYVYTMFLYDREAAVREIQRLEARVLEWLR